MTEVVGNNQLAMMPQISSSFYENRFYEAHMAPLQSFTKPVNELTAYVNDLEESLIREEKHFELFVKKRSQILSSCQQEIERIKKLGSFDMKKEDKRGVQELRQELIQKRERLIKLKQAEEMTDLEGSESDPTRDMNNLHLQVLLDLSKTKILELVGMQSWERLHDRASERGMSPQDFVHDYATLLSQDSLDFICTNDFITPGKYYELRIQRELNDFVYEWKPLA